MASILENVGTFSLFAFAVLSLVMWYFVAKWADPIVRLPLTFYCGFYFVTTLIGATLIGLSDSRCLEPLGWGLDFRILRDVNNLRYWWLLFMPMIVPPATVLLVNKSKIVESAVRGTAIRLNAVPGPMAFIAVYGMWAGYCLAKLYVTGQIGTIFKWQSHRGDYVSMILQRTEMAGMLGSVFFGLVYITLPMLSFYALYCAVRLPGYTWKVIFCGSAFTTAVISLSLMQKGPVLLFFVFIGIGLVELKVIKPRSLAIVGAGLVFLLTTLQRFMADTWSYEQTFNLIVFRMAHSFPYYVNVYPDMLPYFGIDLGLHLIGMGEIASDNNVVFDYMYPNVDWVQGAAPGPAHVRAYGQGGLLFAFVTLAFIGLGIKMAGVLRRYIGGPLSFSLYMASLVCMYFLTQTSAREALLSCYGICWAMPGIVPLWLLSKPVRMPAKSRAVTPSKSGVRTMPSRQVQTLRAAMDAQVSSTRRVA